MANASKLVGLSEIRAVLKTLPSELRVKVMAVALKRAARPLVDAAKGFAARSVKTGALQNSITSLVKKGRGGDSYALVGPSRDYFRGGKKLKKNAVRSGADKPANYAHLVEYGHHAATGAKGGSRRGKSTASAAWVPAKPFMRPAVAAAQSAIAGELAEGVSEGIALTLKRIVKNPASRG